MVILHGIAHPRINIKNTKQKHVVPIIFHEEKEAYARSFRNIYQIILYKFLHLSTLKKSETKKTFQSLSFLKLKSKENFFPMTMKWIVSRSKKLTRSNSFILLLKTLGDKV